MRTVLCMFVFFLLFFFFFLLFSFFYFLVSSSNEAATAWTLKKFTSSNFPLFHLSDCVSVVQPCSATLMFRATHLATAVTRSCNKVRAYGDFFCISTNNSAPGQQPFSPQAYDVLGIIAPTFLAVSFLS